MMFCSKCGTQNPDDSKFCAGCGAALDEGGSIQSAGSSQSHMAEVPLVDDLPEIDIPSGSGVHCPKCKSEKIQSLTETDVQGGYQAGKGCLGYLLFGPLGFLCGALGKKARMTSTNSTMFVCMECGHKFAHLDDMIAEREKKAKLSLITGVVLLILGIWFLFDDFSFEALGGLIIFVGACGGWHIEAKEELNDLRNKGYDAHCYLKKKK